MLKSLSPGCGTSQNRLGWRLCTPSFPLWSQTFIAQKPNGGSGMNSRNHRLPKKTVSNRVGQTIMRLIIWKWENCKTNYHWLLNGRRATLPTCTQLVCYCVVVTSWLYLHGQSKPRRTNYLFFIKKDINCVQTVGRLVPEIVEILNCNKWQKVANHH